MYHQCDRPYDYEAHGDFETVDPVSGARAIAAALLLFLLLVGAPIAFFMGATALGWVCIVVGAVGMARLWTVSVRR